ncbi:hypothetical protein V6C53_08215 [Desulfocurvibacter africanus]|uniref:PilZ domain-containing protein n=1 Tax=Desulfocurvibacter africanus subsp. africanus str. Walvis Bay TaxID=690850 RepID=F3YU12_DESAF|nr:hypothetical protein [Desulfocurvibacter africanus]EGJ48618.1 hypothetical protein Desaf_0260 [Desulfocurvibacter africanus subsp. africanus str. Walvis Bay]
MQWRERRKWQRFDVLQEGVSACSLLDKHGSATHMLIHDIGMGGVRLSQSEDESVPKIVTGAIFTLSGSRMPRFGHHLDGRKVRMVWVDRRACGLRFDIPLFGRPSGFQRLLTALTIPSQSAPQSSFLTRLATRLGWH